MSRDASACCTGINAEALRPPPPTAADREGSCHTVGGPKIESQSSIDPHNQQHGTCLLIAVQHAGTRSGAGLHPDSTSEPHPANLCPSIPQYGSNRNSNTLPHDGTVEVAGLTSPIRPSVPSGSPPCQSNPSASTLYHPDQRLDRLHSLTARISSILEAMGADACPRETRSPHSATTDDTTKAGDRHINRPRQQHASVWPPSRETNIRGQVVDQCVAKPDPAPAEHARTQPHAVPVQQAVSIAKQASTAGAQSFPRALQRGSPGPSQAVDLATNSRSPSSSPAGALVPPQGARAPLSQAPAVENLASLVGPCLSRDAANVFSSARDGRPSSSRVVARKSTRADAASPDPWQLAAVPYCADATCRGTTCLGTANRDEDSVQQDSEVGADSGGPHSVQIQDCTRSTSHSGPANPGEDSRVLLPLEDSLLSSPKGQTRAPTADPDLEGYRNGTHSTNSRPGTAFSPVIVQANFRKTLDSEDESRRRLATATLTTHGRVIATSKSSYQERYNTVSRVLGAVRGQPRTYGSPGGRMRTEPPRGIQYVTTPLAKQAPFQGPGGKEPSPRVPAGGLNHGRNVSVRTEAGGQPSTSVPESVGGPAATTVQVERPGGVARYLPTMEGTAQHERMRPSPTYPPAYFRVAAMRGKSSGSRGHVRASAMQLQAGRGRGSRQVADKSSREPGCPAMVRLQHTHKPGGRTGPGDLFGNARTPGSDCPAQGVVNFQQFGREVGAPACRAEIRCHGPPSQAQAPGTNLWKCESDGGPSAVGGLPDLFGSQPSSAPATWRSCTRGRVPRPRSHSPAARQRLAGPQGLTTGRPTAVPRSQSPTRWRPSSSLSAAEHQRWMRGCMVHRAPPKQVEVSGEQPKQSLGRFSLPSLPLRGSYLERVVKESQELLHAKKDHEPGPRALWDPTYILGAPLSVLDGPVGIPGAPPSNFDDPTGYPRDPNVRLDAALQMPLAQNLVPAAVSGGIHASSEAGQSHEHHVQVPTVGPLMAEPVTRDAAREESGGCRPDSSTYVIRAVPIHGAAEPAKSSEDVPRSHGRNPKRPKSGCVTATKRASALGASTAKKVPRSSSGKPGNQGCRSRRWSTPRLARQPDTEHRDCVNPQAAQVPSSQRTSRKLARPTANVSKSLSSWIVPVQVRGNPSTIVGGTPHAHLSHVPSDLSRPGDLCFSAKVQWGQEEPAHSHASACWTGQMGKTVAATAPVTNGEMALGSQSRRASYQSSFNSLRCQPHRPSWMHMYIPAWATRSLHESIHWMAKTVV